MALVSNGSDTILLLSEDCFHWGQISAIKSAEAQFWCALWTTVSKTIHKRKPSPVGKGPNYESVITLLKGQTLRRLQCNRSDRSVPGPRTRPAPSGASTRLGESAA